MRRRLTVFSLLLFLTACGYGLVGAPDRLPHGIQTLHVALFENRTTEPYLENVITQSVNQRLLRIPELRLQTSVENSDASLSGSVLTYRIEAAAYDALDRPQQYRVVMQIEAQLQRTSDGRILWRGELIRSAEYPADNDLRRQADFETLAQYKVAELLSTDLSYQMAADF